MVYVDGGICGDMYVKTLEATAHPVVMEHTSRRLSPSDPECNGTLPKELISNRGASEQSGHLTCLCAGNTGPGPLIELHLRFL